MVDELGSRKEIEYAYRILEEGTSADRQLATFQTHQQLAGRGRSVDQTETEEGIL